MKRCENCMMNTICTYYDKQHKRRYGMCPPETKKRKRLWCVPTILLITLALVLGGCVHVKLPDGTEYWRVGEQQIGEVLITMPDGTEFLMERQKSTIPVLIVTPAGFQWGEAREVKP